MQRFESVRARNRKGIGRHSDLKTIFKIGGKKRQEINFHMRYLLAISFSFPTASETQRYAECDEA